MCARRPVRLLRGFHQDVSTFPFSLRRENTTRERACGRFYARGVAKYPPARA